MVKEFSELGEGLDLRQLLLGVARGEREQACAVDDVLPPGDVGKTLADAIEAARAGRSDRVTPLLASIAGMTDVDVLTAAGRICLLMRDAAVARPFFRRALERDPTSFRAALGMGSSALMQRDVDAAARAFGSARTLTKDKDERSYLSAAISELNKAHTVMRGTY